MSTYLWKYVHYYYYYYCQFLCVSGDGECVLCRHWLMADSTEECQRWCDRLNVVLDTLSCWRFVTAN